MNPIDVVWTTEKRNEGKKNGFWCLHNIPHQSNSLAQDTGRKVQTEKLEETSREVGGEVKPKTTRFSPPADLRLIVAQNLNFSLLPDQSVVLRPLGLIAMTKSYFPRILGSAVPDSFLAAETLFSFFSALLLHCFNASQGPFLSSPASFLCGSVWRRSDHFI